MAALSRIGLIAKTGDPRAREVLARVAAALAARGATLALEAATATDSGLPHAAFPLDALAARCDLLFVVGGDGTLLAAARAAAPLGLPVAGLNAGRLGFLTDVAPEALDAGLAALLEGRGRAEQRTLVTAEIERADGRRVSAGLALNDAVVQKRAAGRMIELATRVDGDFVCTHRADGIVVATPTGSTAYALSCGGPIIHPKVDALAIVPICPHTLSDRPIVVDGGARIVVSLAPGFAGSAQLTLDGQVGLEVAPGDNVAICRADHRLTLLHPPGHDYFEVLRDKLHWGRGGAPER
jgi:NAD+ kinase